MAHSQCGTPYLDDPIHILLGKARINVALGPMLHGRADTWRVGFSRHEDGRPFLDLVTGLLWVGHTAACIPSFASCCCEVACKQWSGSILQAAAFMKQGCKGTLGWATCFCMKASKIPKFQNVLKATPICLDHCVSDLIQLEHVKYEAERLSQCRLDQSWLTF